MSYGASNWSSTLTLSKGSDSGIEVGDCVMNESGALVGQVIETGSTWATVRTVIDVDMSVGGYVSGSGATAMVLGDFTLMQQGCARFGYLLSARSRTRAPRPAASRPTASSRPRVTSASCCRCSSSKTLTW